MNLWIWYKDDFLSFGLPDFFPPQILMSVKWDSIPIQIRASTFTCNLWPFSSRLWSSVCFRTQLCPSPSSLPPSVTLMQMFSLVRRPEGEITTALGNNAAPCSLYTDTLLPAEAPCQPHLWVGSFAFFLSCLSLFYSSSMKVSSHPNLFYYYFLEDYWGYSDTQCNRKLLLGTQRRLHTTIHPAFPSGGCRSVLVILGKKVAEVTITMI